MLAESATAATTDSERLVGLLKHTSLSKGEGLWIAYCASVHTFWMKFPIDIVYLDEKLTVLKIRHGTPPWRLSMCLFAHGVLELPAGTSAETQTQPGDQLRFEP